MNKESLEILCEFYGTLSIRLLAETNNLEFITACSCSRGDLNKKIARYKENLLYKEYESLDLMVEMKDALNRLDIALTSSDTLMKAIQLEFSTKSIAAALESQKS